MAKNKLVEYLDYPLGMDFEYEYVTVKRVVDETGLPYWIIKELEELYYIADGKITDKGILILKVLMYCFKDRQFLKSAIGRVGYRDRKRMLDNIQKKRNKLTNWIYTRVFNLKDKGEKIRVKAIYNEVSQYFPSLEQQGYFGYKDIKKYINNANRLYRLRKNKSQQAL